MKATEFSPALAHELETKFQALQNFAGQKGFHKIRKGIIDHTDITEVVGFFAEVTNPLTDHDRIHLEITFQDFPTPFVLFELCWSSWMADPAMKGMAIVPPVKIVNKRMSVIDKTAPSLIHERAIACLNKLERELTRGRSPTIFEALFARLF